MTGAAMFISPHLGQLVCKARNKDGMIFRSSPVFILYEVKYQRSEAKENCGPRLPKSLTASLLLNNDTKFVLVLILPKLMSPLSAHMGYCGMFF